MLLKAPAVVEVYLEFSNIGLIGYSTVAAAEISTQVGGRLRE
jgi:hypothetical protein